MIVPYSHVLLLALLLFVMGAICSVTRRNMIMILVGVEIMLNAAGLALVGASLHWGKLDGQIFVLFIMAVAASEVAVGLALILYAHRRTGSVDIERYRSLKEIENP
jgi:NADH-quinone oxidoreductase subunit K